MSSVSLDSSVISPNGHSHNAVAGLHYVLSRRADVTVALTGPGGIRRVLRDGLTRAPGPYTISFDGSFDGRVLPDGVYTWQVQVSNPGVKTVLQERTFKMTIQNADTTPPRIDTPKVFPDPFQPNGNLATDTAIFTYVLSKPAQVTIFVNGPHGSNDGKQYTVVYQDTEQPGPNQAIWTGQISPEQYIPDGTYDWTIEAKDAAGNVSTAKGAVGVTQSGIPDARIEEVNAVEQDKNGQRLIQVQVRIYNSGLAVLSGATRDGAPQDGFVYGSLSASYVMPPPFGPNWGEQAFGRAGTYSVGIDFYEREQIPNIVPPYPFRWAIGGPLQRKESRVITGYIKIPNDYHGQITFYAGIIHEGQGILSGQDHVNARQKLVLS